MNKIGDIIKNNQGYSWEVINKLPGYKFEVLLMDQPQSLTLIVNGSNLNRGEFTNPYHRGVFGVGYLGANRGSNKQAYDTWYEMMRRCYSSKAAHNATSYAECTVDDHWHDYSNFRPWYENNHPGIKGYSLDKDLMVSGNKVYSKDTCVFIPNSLNSKLTTLVRLSVSLDKKSNRWISTVAHNWRMQPGTRKQFINKNDAIAYSRKLKAKYLGYTAIDLISDDRITMKVYKRLMHIIWGLIQ